MTKDDALLMAIEALEDANYVVSQEWSVQGEYDIAIQACKEALEHPNQTYKESSLKWEVETLKFESGDYICPSCGNKSLYKTKQSEWCVTHKCLYQHDYPPKEWQGLSDEQLNKVWNSMNKCVDNSLVDEFEFARAIEAKLKEKNSW